MTTGEGTGIHGIQAVHDVLNQENEHGSDISVGTLTRHLPAPGAALTYAIGDGSNWVISDGFLDVATGKTLTVSNTLTLAGTDGKTLTISNSLTLAGVDGKTLTLTDNLTAQGGGTTTLSSAGAYTLTIPATGTAALGTGAATRIAYWSGANNLTSDANLTWAGTTLTVAGTVAATTVTGANVTSGADPGHTHTGGSIGGIDISDDTNLAVTSPITLTDDSVGMVNQGTTTTVLHGNAAGNPSFSAVSLTADVSGILPSANGGTGVNNAGTITNATNTTITGGGTIALAGYTFTVPATGTAALLATANVFTAKQEIQGGSGQAQLLIKNTAADEAHLHLNNPSGDTYFILAGAVDEGLTGSVAGDFVISHRSGQKIIISADSASVQHHLTILENGNVGIGTTNPGGNLEIADTGFVYLDIVADSDNNQADTDVVMRFYVDGGSGVGTHKGKISYNQGFDAFTLGYGNNNHMVIDSSGNIGIGVTDPDKKLEVAGDIKTTGFFNFGPGVEATIDTDGEITATGSSHNIDTFEDAATDNLVVINGGNIGDILIIRPTNGARDVVVKDGTGIRLDANADFTMDALNDHMVLIKRTATIWAEISRSSN